MPDCENFGVPARTTKGGRGRSKDRDMRYRLSTTSRSMIPSVHCKACSDKPPVKSNAAIAAEIDRLAGIDGLLRPEETIGCRNEDCENHGRPVALYPRHYRKHGNVAGYGPRYLCKGCGKTVLLSRPVRLHDRHRRMATDVLSRIANKSPVRRTVLGAGLASTQSYYPVLDFIHDRCRAYSGAVDRAFMEGRLKLPADMNVESDGQVYTLNWPSRLDRLQLGVDLLLHRGCRLPVHPGHAQQFR